MSQINLFSDIRKLIGESGTGILMIKGDASNPVALDLRFRSENSFVYLERYNGTTWDILGTWGGSFQTDKIYLNSSTGVKGIFDNTDMFEHINYIRTTSKKGGVDVGDQNINLYLTAKDKNSILISYPKDIYTQNVVTSIETPMPVGTYTTTFTWNQPTSEFKYFVGYVDQPSKGRLIISETDSGRVIWENMTEAEYFATGGNSSIEAIRDENGNIIGYKTTGYVTVAVNPTAYLYEGVNYTATLHVSGGVNYGNGTFPYFVIKGLESISIPIYVDASKQYYVDGINGDDSIYNGKSINAPFKTIQHAINVATSNSSIYVSTGTYTENITIGNGKSVYLNLGDEISNAVKIHGTLDISSNSAIYTVISGGEITGLTTINNLLVTSGGIRFKNVKLSGGHTIAGSQSSSINFENCYLLGVGSVNYTAISLEAKIQYKSCYMMDMTSFTINGVSAVAMVKCEGLPTITHINGYLGISDCLNFKRDTNGYGIICTANLSATNSLIISNTSLYQIDGTYAIINKTGTCIYAITKVARTGLDILNGTRINVDNDTVDLVYESNAAAKAAGYPVGTRYRTSTGILMVVY